MLLLGLGGIAWFGLPLPDGPAKQEAAPPAAGSVTLAVPKPPLPPRRPAQPAPQQQAQQQKTVPQQKPVPQKPAQAEQVQPQPRQADAIGDLIEALDEAGPDGIPRDEAPARGGPPATALAALAPAPFPARPSAPKGGTPPRIAIVIDDLGGSSEALRRLMNLPGPVSYAFLTVHEAARSQSEKVAAAGYDVLLHLPMEPQGAADPGPNALLTGNDTEENLRRLRWHLARLPRAIGVNNHMGSRFTADAERMRPVLRAIADAGLFWLDSRTSGNSAGFALARELQMRSARRDVFLDHKAERAAILRQLAEAEDVALRQGHAVAIGHPYPETLAALEAWMPDAQSRGFTMVRLSDLLPPAPPPRRVQVSH